MFNGRIFIEIINISFILEKHVMIFNYNLLVYNIYIQNFVYIILCNIRLF